MPDVGFILHKGHRLLFTDFARANPSAILELIQRQRPLMHGQAPNSVLSLVDVTDARYDKEASEALKTASLENKPYIRKTAVVGVEGMKRIIFSAVTSFSGRSMRLFDDLETAKDWLVSNADADAGGTPE